MRPAPLRDTLRIGERAPAQLALVHEPKPHDPRCQCLECEAWARRVFSGTTRSSEAPSRTWPPRPHLRCSPELPSVGGVCACLECVKWARAIVEAPTERREIGPEPVPPFVKQNKLPPASAEARAAVDAHVRELLTLNNDPRRHR